MEVGAPATTSLLAGRSPTPPIFQAGHEGSIPFARSHCPGPGQGPYRPSGRMVLKTLTTSFVPATCQCRAPWGQRSSPRTDPVRAASGSAPPIFWSNGFAEPRPSLGPVPTRLDLGACEGTEQTRPQQSGRQFEGARLT